MLKSNLFNTTGVTLVFCQFVKVAQGPAGSVEKKAPQLFKILFNRRAFTAFTNITEALRIPSKIPMALR